MPITVNDNTFTSSTTSEAPSSFVAGTVSFNGLVNLFGNTGSTGVSETEVGLMTIPTLTDWFSRLYSKSYGISGPTGAWAGEWWAVHNYLQYGGSCVIGGTGSTGDYFSANGAIIPTQTPLHNPSLVSIDAIFDCGNTASAQVAINVATTRQDCVAVIGNYKKITGAPGLTQNYSGRTADFGFNTSSPYVVYVAGRKKFVAGVSDAVNILEANLSPDVAGCMARSARDERIWVSPAGKTRGRVLGVVALQQAFLDTDSTYILNSNVNPVMTLPGQGTYLMGNKTSQTSGALSRLNVVMMITYLRKQLENIAENFLFEINNANTRQEIISSMIPILEDIKGGNGISAYKIVCDETNNTSSNITNGQLVVDVYVDSTYVAETIQIQIVNSTTTETFIA